MVPLDTPILSPASSCDNPSRSTSLKASNSAISIEMESESLDGLGTKLVAAGVIPSLKDFGILPLLPLLRLRCHIELIITVAHMDNIQ